MSPRQPEALLVGVDAAALLVVLQALAVAVPPEHVAPHVARAAIDLDAAVSGALLDGSELTMRTVLDHGWEQRAR